MGLEDLHIALFQMTWGGNKVLKNVEIQFALRSLSVVLYHNDYVSWVTCELYSPYFCLKVTTSDLLNFFYTTNLSISLSIFSEKRIFK